MSVINGATNAITNITNPLGSNTGWIAVNPATNRIYPPGGTPPSSFIPAYLIINGSTNSVTESAPFYFPLGTSTGAPDVAADALYTDGISDAGPTFLVYQVDANSWTDFGDCAVGPSLLLADPVSHLVYEGYSGFGVIDPATQSYPVCAQFSRRM